MDYPEEQLVGIEGKNLISHGQTAPELVKVGIRRVALDCSLEILERLALVEAVRLLQGLALLEVGLAVKLSSLDVAEAVLLGGAEEDQVSGELLALFDVNDVSGLEIPALADGGGSFRADLEFDIVGPLVRPVATLLRKNEKGKKKKKKKRKN